MKKITATAKGQKGFTLVELMVAMSLGLILLLSGAAMYSQLKLKIAIAQDAKSLRQKARITLNILARITSAAGNTYCLDRNTLNTDPLDPFWPIQYTTSGPLSRLTIMAPIPLGLGFNYFNNRAAPGSSNPYVNVTTPGGVESVCGQSTTRYYASRYTIVSDGNSLVITNFDPARNFAGGFQLVQSLQRFNVQFGLADAPEDEFTTRYVDTFTDDERNMIRSVRYTITIGSNRDAAQLINLSRVVMLQNPWVIE